MQLRGAFSRRVRRFRHRGSDVECPCCHRTWGSFAPHFNRPDAICPGCGSQERHRLVWLYLTEVAPPPPEGIGDVLHFAPDALRPLLLGLPGIRYTTCDLDPAGVDVQADITALPFADASFDAVICSHVLEHVEADGQAMSELRRVVRPGGWAMVMVPIELSLEQTYENPDVTAPEDRLTHFLQEDHVRLYGVDIADRLEAAGFDVEVVRLAEELGPEARRRHGLLTSDVIFRCVRPVADPAPA